MQHRRHMVDLFSGCGGFGLGARAAGFGAELAFDVDPILTSSHALNFPGSELTLADLSKASGKEIKAKAGGNVLGVFGGPPCQAFSAMGHRNADDPRRELLGHFFRLVDEIGPAFFVMENVVGLSYADAKPELDVALDAVARRYKIVGPMILDAADFGAATKRRRLFVIGYDPLRCDPFGEADLLAATKPAATVADAIADLALAVETGETDGYDHWTLPIGLDDNPYRASLRSVDGTFTGHRPTIHTDAVVARFAAVPPGGVDKIGRHPRLRWDGQCPTLRAGTGSDRGSFQSVRPIHPDTARVITVREAARLQGFPDSFKFHPTVWHSFRMIGNSVSPIMSEAIFTTLRSKLFGGQSALVAAE